MTIKKLLLSLSLIGALVISQAASADNRHHRRGYIDYGFNNHNYRNSYRRGHRVNSYHYGSRDRRYRRGFSFSYGNYYPRHRRHDSGSFVGGLLLGSLLSYPRYDSHSHSTVVYKSAPVTHSREIVYVDRAQTSRSTPVTSGRSLLRDLEGNCFERNIDENGDEIRVQLEPEECSF